MEATPGNPPENALPAGIAESALLEALAMSGYPLQVSVARRLREISGYPSTDVVEEWTFVDRDEGKLRALDIVLDLTLPFTPTDRTYASLALLIECKSSAHPFVFFESPPPYDLAEYRCYPKIVGLPHKRLKLTAMAPPYMWASIVPQQLLAIRDLRSTLHPAAHASSYTKIVPTGKKAKTSGEEPYSAIVLPLLKAITHFAAVKAPAAEHTYFNAIATFAVAVLDAPLLLSRLDGAVVRAPWVRLSKHELAEGDRPEYRDDVSAIDFVHAAYFDRYVSEFILPFATQYKDRVKRQADVLAAGNGKLPKLIYEDQYFFNNASA